MGKTTTATLNTPKMAAKIMKGVDQQINAYVIPAKRY
jgi:hypothetical protein